MRIKQHPQLGWIVQPVNGGPWHWFSSAGEHRKATFDAAFADKPGWQEWTVIDPPTERYPRRGAQADRPKETGTIQLDVQALRGYLRSE